jgi:hypothetical protein
MLNNSFPNGSGIPKLLEGNPDYTLKLPTKSTSIPKESWGIFDKNNIKLGAGLNLSTSSVVYARDSNISEYPLEQGSFESFNKVQLPAISTITLCLQGSEADRTKFLNQIDLASKSVDLYTIVTPEVQYINFNIQRYDYTRSAQKGASMLTVVLHVKEIRQNIALSSSAPAPKNPNATPPVSNGKPQPVPAQKSFLRNGWDWLKSWLQ